MSKKMKANLLLFIAAFIWGTAFVAQKSGGAIGSFTFNGIRTFIGGLVLLPLVIKNHKDKSLPLFTKEELTGGIVCGFFLFVAASLQQFGLAYTTAGKAAFITTLYVVFCPILSLIVHKKKTRPLVWLCVVLDVIGLYLLCMTDASFSIQIGDTLVILCAVAFAGQMVAVDNFIDRIDGIKLSCIQFLFSGLLGIICMFIFEPLSLEDFTSMSTDYESGLSEAISPTAKITISSAPTFWVTTVTSKSFSRAAISLWASLGFLSASSARRWL